MGSGGVMLAYSTGNQRSSRLLSMLSANALLFLPRGPGVVPVGSTLQALVIRPLKAAPKSISVHPSAALLDYADDEEVLVHASTCVGPSTATENLPSPQPANSGFVSLSSMVAKSSEDWRTISVGLLSISDRASRGVYEDKSIPELTKQLKDMSEEEGFPLTFVIKNTAIVPDEPDAIAAVVTQWTNPTGSNPTPGSPGIVASSRSLHVDLLLTSGGTGFGRRDLTPEALRPLLHREAPGVAQHLLNEGLKHTPLAVMSRPIAGTRNDSFICTLPGSAKAIKENIVCLKVLLPRILELLKAETPADAPH